MKKEQTHFGYKTVDAEEKNSLVGRVFASVATRYDLMNDLMSGGLHRLWKDRMVRLVPMQDGARILDVAGGTGDIALRMYSWAEQHEKRIHITVCDINGEMLKQGKARAIDRNIIKEITWKQGDAEQLPFGDGSFDAYTIAFGIRNVTHIDKALSEACRVLKPGGKFVCLEFSNVDNAMLSRIYDAYSFTFVPKIGKAVTGDEEAYRYLVESIRKFPAREQFTGMMEQAGFANIGVKPLNHGIVAIHTGWRV